MMGQRTSAWWLGGIGLLCLGCGEGETAAPVASAPSAVTAPATTGEPAASPAVATTPAAPIDPTPAPAAPSAPAPLPKISLGGGGSKSSGGGSAAGTDSAAASFSRDDVLAALKPMQILRDEWNAIRQKSVGGQDAGEEFSWIWDHRTNPKQPALVLQSPQGKYFHQLRLTYDPSTSQFQLQLTDPEDRERVLVGDYSQPVEEVQMGDKKIHRIYKLQLDELAPQDDKDQWQLVLNQQENNRYLLELSKKRGSGWQRFETISAQRKGTSFALSDTDYKEKTCVVSGGLGTMQVSFNGKNYWVCCTGCQAAFNDEPARWIADFESKQKLEQ